jgi:hypothetical protein
VSDRLADLQRQRALAQEQVAWFDREIARQTGAAVSAPLASPSDPARPVAAANPPPHFSAVTNRAADDILAQYQSTAGDTARDVKKGCYLYFIFAMGLLTLGFVCAWYLYANYR